MSKISKHDVQDIQISLASAVGTVTIGNSRFEITPDSNVVAYTDQTVELKPVTAATAEGTIASIGKDFAVAVYGAKITKMDAGFTVQAASTAMRPPAAIVSFERGILEVGDHLKDGTIVLSVDLEKNEALFVPGNIFGGYSTFRHQDRVVEAANRNMAHGHEDWRRITEAEGVTLSQVWDKVAPPILQGRYAPHFWTAAPVGMNQGIHRQGGWEVSHINYLTTSHDISSRPVPVVRSGPIPSRNNQGNSAMAHS